MHLMVGGRDAKGNDSIVKKHLKADDRYVHADLHGAPSCAMKLQQGFIIDPNPPQNLPSGVPSFLLSDNIEVPNFSSTRLIFSPSLKPILHLAKAFVGIKKTICGITHHL